MKKRQIIACSLLLVLSACSSTQLIQSSKPTSSLANTPPSKEYFFAPHTADEAQEILSKAEAAILEDFNLEMPLSQYSLLYRAAFYAARNAYLYFPEDQRAKMWEWKMAYYAAMGGDNDFAAHIYTQKITRALNEDNVPVNNLPSWFQSGEVNTEYITPHFDLELQPVNIPNYDQSYLVQLGVQGGVDIPGVMCLLLSKHKEQFEVFLVYNGFPENGFFPTLRHPSYCITEDTTGDGIDEVIADNWSGGHVGTSSLQISDISTLPPKQLTFGAENKEILSVWNGSAEEFINKDEKIQIPIREKFGQCDIYLRRYYEWDGNRFEAVNVSLSLIQGGITDLEDCYYYIPYSLDEFTASEAAQILDEAVKIYSPGSDSEKDILEEFRVKKALVYLFAGETSKAIEVFEEIANKPLKEGGIWVEPVKNFLKTYQKPSDLYRACVALTAHDLNRPVMFENKNNITHAVINLCHLQALEITMSKAAQSQSIENFNSYLDSNGVKIASKDWLDIDQDGKDELWFMTEPPTQLYYQLWFVSDYPHGIKILDGGTYPTPQFRPNIQQLTANRFLIEVGQPRKLIWLIDQSTKEPFLNSLNEWQDPNDITDYSAIVEDLKKFAVLQEQIYVSKSFEVSYKKMLEIVNRYDTCPHQLLSPATNFYKYECGDYYYTIGFAAELAGDNNFAQKMYAKIIELYPNNPMVLLAKEKISH
jgi:hypothetical protein